MPIRKCQIIILDAFPIILSISLVWWHAFSLSVAYINHFPTFYISLSPTLSLSLAPPPCLGEWFRSGIKRSGTDVSGVLLAASQALIIRALIVERVSPGTLGRPISPSLSISMEPGSSSCPRGKCSMFGL